MIITRNSFTTEEMIYKFIIQWVYGLNMAGESYCASLQFFLACLDLYVRYSVFKYPIPLP